MMLYLSSILLTLTLCRITATTPQPEVTAPAGTFRGKVLTSDSGADYNSYRGIPFALPPTGERRFAKPVPHPPIQGVYDAVNFGSICLQQLNGVRLGTEDCLYLNVYTPLEGQTTETTDLKKVLVYIHGGGFAFGASNPYIPGDLVTRSDLVVVTLNYRLTWFGFLRGNSSSLPGNVAFWDQLLALQWVKDNIQYFGGDPNDVTLSGESAGSMSASILSVSPAAKGLFSKAVLLSGVASTLPIPDRKSNDLLEIAANKFGCGVSSLPGNEDQVVACLRQVPAENFVLEFDFPLLMSGTCSGDDLIPRHLLELLNDSGYLSKVGFFDRDYLVSVTADDGYVFVGSIIWKMDTSSLDSIVRSAWWLKLPGSVSEVVIHEYQRLYGDLVTSVTSLATDFFFLRKSLDFLDVFSSRPKQAESKRNGNAYLLSFDHKPRYVQNHYMLHALDLCYLFDVNAKEFVNRAFHLVAGDFYDEDVQLKSAFIDVVSDFVKTGKPGERLTEENDLVWPLYDSAKKSYLSFSLQPSVGEDLLGDRRVIWDQLVPQWLEEHKVVERKQEL